MPLDLSALLHGDLKNLIETVSYIGVFGIVFVESGLLVGFFLPGDSLLFTAGFLASQGLFNITILGLGCFIAAVAGDSVGYFIGQKFGKKLYNRKNSKLFNKEHLVKAQKFYDKHGGKTIIIARFMPIIRTFAPVVAGMADMKYSTFLFFNLFGGFLWAVGLTVAGYFLGAMIPDVDKYLLPIIGAIVLLSIAPGILHLLKTRAT
ncbi:MAG: hypothetical protein US86_C0003G0009 [Candidatus Daviesbacteria bacterium GW2011_GWA2_38_24]|uniref:VTT domain-containing protein n=1 Tax=Candidatus Daviesbacteria bacterium GW2011_GWA2_38_24 TaxID=1618422 RepID=A0A0G0MPE3_9BACT|nr:MAG: hypothetical protein US86_C0003G0009 [Candidatus Daviesbacteria bacterium GW2011_GWA2_38_24]KKQ80429.1 MAG: hypothetical protein UT01_C0012G0009 [Candidatus Daviesbacteria bacterium GW2011_GWA1_38_7]OGE23874.1 MAG: hypothetical protein A2688_04165 [Candidatus Daviesbacteria bacterium RIFCSPHIGHO2_01_FULL_38_8]